MTAFVAHASEDRGFVEFLAEILNRHGVETRSGSADMESGRRSSEEIDSALTSADTLLVAVSENALRSRRVHQEVSYFQVERPDGRIVLLMLGPIRPNAVHDGLGDCQCLRFDDSMLQGFRDLLAVFGKSFLGQNETGLRAPVERRSGRDRRCSSVLQRLRKGFWFAYYRATEAGKFEPLRLDVQQMCDTVDALLPEAVKYTYRAVTSGEQRGDIKAILMESAQAVWERMRDRDLRAVLVIEAIAEEVCGRFQVASIDRRANPGGLVNAATAHSR